MHPIESIDMVSDGIIVAFSQGHSCYFSAAFLKEHIGRDGNQVFLNHDPSPADQPLVPFAIRTSWPNQSQGSSEGLVASVNAPS
jgi:hypothetical protein